MHWSSYTGQPVGDGKRFGEWLLLCVQSHQCNRLISFGTLSFSGIQRALRVEDVEWLLADGLAKGRRGLPPGG